MELVGWISATDEKASGQTAALKKLGREMHKKCTLVAAREKLALKASPRLFSDAVIAVEKLVHNSHGSRLLSGSNPSRN